MRITTFTIEGTMPGMNEIIAEARRNRYAGAKQKRDATLNCGLAIMRAKVPEFRVPVWIDFHWYEPNQRRDPDNIRAGSKFILDALVEMGKIPGDSRRWIVSLSDDFLLDVLRPRVEVFIGTEQED